MQLSLIGRHQNIGRLNKCSLLTTYFTLMKYTKKNNKMRTRWSWWWWIRRLLCFHLCHFVILLLVELMGQCTYILHIPILTRPNFYFYLLFSMQPQTLLLSFPFKINGCFRRWCIACLFKSNIYSWSFIPRLLANGNIDNERSTVGILENVDMIDLGSLHLLDGIWIQQDRCVWIPRRLLFFANFAC
jgi:hypothetical protein